MTILVRFSSVFLATATLAALSAATPAKADNAAFCIQAYGTSGLAGCNYYTLAQCQAAVRGTAGSCVINARSTNRPSAFARMPTRAAR